MPRTNHHVAIVINNYPPKVGGLEQHVSMLASTLAKAGTQVTVIALDNDHLGFEDGLVKVHRLRATRTVAGVLSAPLLGTTRQVYELLASQGVTLISTHTRFFPMSFVGIRLGKLLGVPVIHTEHGSDFVRGVSPLVSMASKIVDKTMGRYILRRASAVLAISDGARTFVRRLSGVESQVFHNAIDVAAFQPLAPRTQTRQRLVFLGRLVPGKGWELALHVAEVLALEYPELEIHFIGDGAERQRLEDQLRTSRVSAHGTVHGYLGSEEIRDLLTDSILLNPTTLSEGFQTTMLEAIVGRAAVVSTPVSAACYLAELGANVKVVPADEPAHWVQATRDLLAVGWQQPAPEIFKNFDWEGRAEEYLKVADIVTEPSREL
ncbi:glycosyltransferase family 4 protein [Arthrobacter cryoconiti]|uniref:Glycosyltransferase family 4 protein n=1 Tax=Arthrobacter cryoconiti TaxID=748907 RepID=A0ABV8QVN0_9MICC|nr:glycosyltransferase family 4 protein [Arthrobacter cryoconiti]MCC9069031.1 glycosyltransferase family 4 protein [Arthrobacter cryoconiti]